MFIDPRSRASRPAELSVHWPTYVRRHPQGMCWAIAAGICAAGVGWLIESRLAWAGAGLASGLFLLLHVRYVHARFAGGMLCPGLVVSEKPFLVAVLTDLASTSDTRYPVLKVFHAPAPGSVCPKDTRLACVVLYSGVTPAGHWDDCQPALALNANAAEWVHEELLQRVPPAEWDTLNTACATLSLPARCELRPLRPTLARNRAALQ